MSAKITPAVVAAALVGFLVTIGIILLKPCWVELAAEGSNNPTVTQRVEQFGDGQIRHLYLFENNRLIHYAQISDKIVYEDKTYSELDGVYNVVKTKVTYSTPNGTTDSFHMDYTGGAQFMLSKNRINELNEKIKHVETNDIEVRGNDIKNLMLKIAQKDGETHHLYMLDKEGKLIAYFTVIGKLYQRTTNQGIGHHNNYPIYFFTKDGTYHSFASTWNYRCEKERVPELDKQLRKTGTKEKEGTKSKD